MAAAQDNRRFDLSVCTTNYNCAHALEAHLDSLYAQLEAFEYVVVDNQSRDGSLGILRRYARDHGNVRIVVRRCSRGAGRQLAAEASRGAVLLTVDTDTVYRPTLRPFVDRAVAEYPHDAVQAIYAGVYPRSLWFDAGGMRDLNYGEDVDLWVRLWRMGRIRFYPARLGDNRKEEAARDRFDPFSSRYGKAEGMGRLLRREFDYWRLRSLFRQDLEGMWKGNAVDFGLGVLEGRWVTAEPPTSPMNRLAQTGRSLLRILRS